MASQSQVVWEEGTDPPQLLAAALPFLVERILDPNLTAIEFLLVFPSFTTGHELLSLIATIWHTILKGEIDLKATLPSGVREHHDLVKFDVRKKKIIDFLHLWIFDHWIDFRTSTELQQQLQTMLKTKMEPNCPRTHLKNFLALLAKKQAEGSDHPPRKKRSVQPPPPLLRGGKENLKMSKNNTLTVSDLLPEEVARQITIRESELYGRINVRELIRQGWNKKGQEERCKYLLAYIGNFNRISFLVQTEVLRIEEARQRAVALGIWITVAEKCRDLKNYNAVMEIISALGSSSISRLAATWALVSEDRKQALVVLQQVTKRTSNFKELRVAMDGATGACVPYIGMYLGDLTFIEDGNILRSDFDQSLVHYSKWKLAANVIQKIQSLQRLGYVFEELPPIQMWLASGEACEEKTLYQMSLQLEARGSSDSSRAAAAAPAQQAASSGGSVLPAFVRRMVQKDSSSKDLKDKEKEKEKDGTATLNRRKSEVMSISMPIGRSETTTIIDTTKLSPRGHNKHLSGTLPLGNSSPSSALSASTGVHSSPLSTTPASPPSRRPASGLPPIPPAGRDKSPMPQTPASPPRSERTPSTLTGSPHLLPLSGSKPSIVPSLSLTLATTATNPPLSTSPRSGRALSTSLPSSGPQLSPRSTAVPPPSPRSAGPAITSEEETVTEKPDLLIVEAPETLSPNVKKCAKCLKPVDGGYIMAEGKPYHDKCFTCSFCHVVLDRFVSCKIGSMDQFFCMEHSHLANPMPCAICAENIKSGEQYITPHDDGGGSQEVHARCFKCCKCQQQLKHFRKIISMYYCATCAEKQEQEMAHLRAKPLPPAPGKQLRANSHPDLGGSLNKDKSSADPKPVPTPPQPFPTPVLGDRPKATSMAGIDTLQRTQPDRNAGSLDAKASATPPATPEKDRENKEMKKDSSGGLSGLFNKTKNLIDKARSEEKEKPSEEPPAPKPDPGPPTGKTCTGCSKAIFGGYSTLSNQAWHPTCIKCNVCHCDLTGQSILVHDGKLFCKEHYEKKAAPRCAECGKGITGAFVNALGKPWHQGCLVCHKCKKDLGGGLYEKNGKPACAQHAK